MKLTGPTIYLRFYEESDAEARLSLFQRNEDFFRPYLFTMNKAFYTIEGQKWEIQKAHEGRDEDRMYSFGIFLNDTDELIGGISLFQVLRDPLQSCVLGYQLDQQHNGKGIMTEAVKLIVEYGIQTLGLHRIEAGVQPHNIGSMRVLEKAGFIKEGIARKNVMVNGHWKDHQMLAIIQEDLEHLDIYSEK